MSSILAHFSQGNWESLKVSLHTSSLDSNIDQVYQPRNDPSSGFLYFYGTQKSIAKFDGKKWKMETAFFNTNASIDAKPDSFMLGKRNWSIIGDSDDCNSGKTYTTELKLTGCAEGSFTCDDGECIQMEERCDQIPDCNDESDENNCNILVLRNGYNKNVPPINSSDPVNITISMNVLKLVDIDEDDYSIEIQFEIIIRWKDIRATFQNLKDRDSLNALTQSDYERLWLPKVIYENTDQKETTRLGSNWEWETRVVVKREGKFIRSGPDVLDEIEIFKGSENSLVLNQTYTHTFQCLFKLSAYPFDTQVG